MSEKSLVALARELVSTAREEGRQSLREHEVYRLLEAGGLRVPAFHLLAPGERANGVDLPGRSVVVKVVSDAI